MAEIRLDPAKTALVVIDLQKGIVANFDGTSVVKNAAALCESFRKTGAFVVLVNVDLKDGKDALNPITDNSKPRGKMPAGWSDLVPELNRQDSDLAITKRGWGAFYGTELDLQLRRRKIETIVLCGISTNHGVETTAREAYAHGYNQVFAIDAMTSSPEEHEHTKKFIFPRIGLVRTTEEILKML